VFYVDLRTNSDYSPVQNDYYLDTLGTATVCAMLLFANKADLLVSKRQPVLLLCSRSHDPAKVATSSFARNLHSSRIFSFFPNRRTVKSQTEAAEGWHCTSELGTY
jgi:hypothetical protein